VWILMAQTCRARTPALLIDERVDLTNGDLPTQTPIDLIPCSRVIALLILSPLLIIHHEQACCRPPFQLLALDVTDHFTDR
jgi:hypothetical protein